MKRHGFKRLIPAILAVLMIFMLAGCQVSSSSTTTVTTSKTDSNGVTTTQTTTTEVGTDGTTKQNTTETVTGPAEEENTADAAAWDELVERMYATYSEGAEGKNEDGDFFYYAFSEETDDVALVMISADEQHYTGFEGVAQLEDDHIVLVSGESGDEVPYVFSDVDENGSFTMTFLGDGDVVNMQLVDQDTILSDILARIEEFQFQ